MSFRVKINQAPSTPLGVTRTAFLITINTQKAFTDTEKAAAAKAAFSEIIEEILGDFTSYLKMYEAGTDEEGKKSYLQIPLQESQVRDGEAEAKFEVGSKMHKVHAHARVSFEHDIGYGFQVDLKKLRADLPSGFHLDVRYLRDASANATKYIHKGV